MQQKGLSSFRSSLDFEVILNKVSIRQPRVAIPNLNHRAVLSVASNVPLQPRQQPFANVTGLFSDLPPSHHTQERSPLHRGLNFVSVRLLLSTTSILGSTMCGSHFWLEGKQVASGIEVLSGPFNFHELP